MIRRTALLLAIILLSLYAIALIAKTELGWYLGLHSKEVKVLAYPISGTILYANIILAVVSIFCLLVRSKLSKKIVSGIVFSTAFLVAVSGTYLLRGSEYGVPLIVFLSASLFLLSTFRFWQRMIVKI